MSRQEEWRKVHLDKDREQYKDEDDDRQGDRKDKDTIERPENVRTEETPGDVKHPRDSKTDGWEWREAGMKRSSLKNYFVTRSFLKGNEIEQNEMK